MNFRSDSQRKAMFANMFSGDSKKDFLIKKGKGGVAVYDDDFLEDMQRPGTRSPKEKKDIAQMIRDEGGEPDNMSKIMVSDKKLENVDTSLKSVKEAYDEIWDSDADYDSKEKQAMAFLDAMSKGDDKSVVEWASDELYEMVMDKKTERDERNMEDMSFYTGDPDAGAPDGTEFSKESLKVAEDALVTMEDKGAKEEEINSYLTGMSKMDDADVSEWAKKKLENDGMSQEEYDNDQMAMGLEVEKEHAGTYEMIEDYYTKNERMPPEVNVYQSIAEEHLQEFPTYYTHLKKMEEEIGV